MIRQLENMRIKALIAHWQAEATGQLTEEQFSVCLPLKEAAKIQALVEIFPGHTQEQIISELLTAALEQMEEDLPYVPGHKVIGHDEFGDPLYEDIGLTHKFTEMTKKHLKSLRSE